METLSSVVYIEEKWQQMLRSMFYVNCTINFIVLIMTCTHWSNFFYIVEKNDRIFPPLQIAKVGRSVTFTCYSDKAPVWRFIQKSRSSGSWEWKVIPNNTETSKSDLSDEYYLTIVKVRKFNHGQYGCYGQHLDIYFKSVGSLQVVGT